MYFCLETDKLELDKSEGYQFLPAFLCWAVCCPRHCSQDRICTSSDSHGTEQVSEVPAQLVIRGKALPEAMHLGICFTFVEMQNSAVFLQSPIFPSPVWFPVPFSECKWEATETRGPDWSHYPPTAVCLQTWSQGFWSQLESPPDRAPRGLRVLHDCFLLLCVSNLLHSKESQTFNFMPLILLLRETVFRGFNSIALLNTLRFRWIYNPGALHFLDSL